MKIYETLGGEHITISAAHMVDLVKKTKDSVKTEFNGVTLTAKPGDKPDQIVQRYKNRIRRKQQRKFKRLVKNILCNFQFCIRYGQLSPRSDMITRNSGWYNKQGEKIGLGDLSRQDFRRISGALPDKELFIVLSEGDERALKHELEQKAMNEPNIDCISQHAQYVLARNKMYLVDRFSAQNSKRWRWRGLSFKVINCQAVKNLMTSGVVG